MVKICVRRNARKTLGSSFSQRLVTSSPAWSIVQGWLLEALGEEGSAIAGATTSLDPSPCSRVWFDRSSVPSTLTATLVQGQSVRQAEHGRCAAVGVDGCRRKTRNGLEANCNSMPKACFKSSQTGSRQTILSSLSFLTSCFPSPHPWNKALLPSTPFTIDQPSSTTSCEGPCCSLPSLLLTCPLLPPSLDHQHSLTWLTKGNPTAAYRINHLLVVVSDLGIHQLSAIVVLREKLGLPTLPGKHG